MFELYSHKDAPSSPLERALNTAIPFDYMSYRFELSFSDIHLLNAQDLIKKLDFFYYTTLSFTHLQRKIMSVHKSKRRFMFNALHIFVIEIR